MRNTSADSTSLYRISLTFVRRDVEAHASLAPVRQLGVRIHDRPAGLHVGQAPNRIARDRMLDLDDVGPPIGEHGTGRRDEQPGRHFDDPYALQDVVHGRAYPEPGRDDPGAGVAFVPPSRITSNAMPKMSRSVPMRPPSRKVGARSRSEDRPASWRGHTLGALEPSVSFGRADPARTRHPSFTEAAAHPNRGAKEPGPAENALLTYLSICLIFCRDPVKQHFRGHACPDCSSGSPPAAAAPRIRPSGGCIRTESRRPQR